MYDAQRRCSAFVLALVVRVRNAEDGATAAEYALLVTFIAIAIAGSIALVGRQLDSAFAKLTEGIEAGQGG